MNSHEDPFLYFPLFDNTSSHQSEDAETRAALEEFSKNPPFIGLKLRKTPSLLELIETKLNAVPETNHHKIFHRNQILIEKADKFKAMHFPFSLLRIGAFTVVAIYEADLVAKCYYAKRKLVWEILVNGLKNKIEILWQDILAMRAIFHQNQPGILELELSQPPIFFHESDPKPRKHTIWRASSDFTGGHASVCRRHYLEFPPGILEKHYEKLIQCDSRLWQLSQRPFPSLASPYFSSNLYHGVTNFHHGSKFISASQQTSCIPAPMFSAEQVEQFGNIPPSLGIKESTSPPSDLDSETVWRERRMAKVESLSTFAGIPTEATQNDYASDELHPASNANVELFDEGWLLYTQLPNYRSPPQVFNENLHTIHPPKVPHWSTREHSYQG